MEKVECSICLNKFIDPRILECGHTFCFNCLNQVLHNSTIRCPDCRAEIHIENISHITKNFILVSLMESLNTKSVNHEKNREEINKTDCEMPSRKKMELTTNQNYPQISDFPKKQYLEKFKIEKESIVEEPENLKEIHSIDIKEETKSLNPTINAQEYQNEVPKPKENLETKFFFPESHQIPAINIELDNVQPREPERLPPINSKNKKRNFKIKCKGESVPLVIGCAHFGFFFVIVNFKQNVIALVFYFTEEQCSYYQS